ncbi:hypothetical protein [Psychroserpens mesophilus]|uniref:hypothetical protein n=1 Tax=Psychroserpens mesophilus TaxID=325473 RepID=UPI00058CBA7D|nr:hypothetical protein [Psychroserpens mesophilus]
MMKKKYLNIALFVLVLIIYAGVFSKIFGKKPLETNSQDYNFSFTNQIPKFDIKRNNFDINNIENDPFGINKRIKNPITVSKSKPVKTSGRYKTSEIKKQWPLINYYGFVKSNGKSTRLALIKINSKLYRKREQESVEDIRIIRAYNDSIVIKLNNETKTITRINEKFKDFTNN